MKILDITLHCDKCDNRTYSKFKIKYIKRYYAYLECPTCRTKIVFKINRRKEKCAE